jgi:succinate-semialdehyde dehydrogenase/glutarate-semialdehyde dehydrogenase
MITRKLGAALAAGCTAVIKPPPETPFSALALAEVCSWSPRCTINNPALQLGRRAGIPDGVVNIVPTLNYVSEVGKEMCQNKIVKKVSFTGSTNVAKLLYGLSSTTLKK